ncbi:MAG: hypothetical protein C4567_10320, partial [Deltaproteobacteria bacterium]
VVADEVRSLAMRAAEAAKNTADLLEGTVTKVKEGSGLVEKTAEAFSRMADSTVKVKELVAEIAAASNEQAQGVEQINKAVDEMNNVTQQVAANAEESASASEELNAQSAQLKVAVGELAALAGGGKNGLNAPGYNQGLLLPPPGSAKVRQAPKDAPQAGLVASNRRKTVNPEQIIPLEGEDRAFKDF